MAFSSGIGRWDIWASKEIRIVGRLVPFLRHHRLAVMAVAALGVMASFAEGIGLGLFIPLLQGINGGQGEPASPLGSWLEAIFGGIPADRRAVVILLVIFGAIMFKALLTLAYEAVSGRLYSRVTHELRAKTFSQLLRVGYAYIQQRRVGSLSYTLATATWEVGDAIGVLLKLIVGLSTALVYLTLLLLISWELTLIVAVVTLLIGRIGYFIRSRSAVLGRVMRIANAGLAHRMFQGIQAMKVIRIFARESFEQARFEQTSSRVSRVLFRLGLLKATLEPAYEVLIVALLLGILAVGLQNPGTLPSMFVYILLLYRMHTKVKQIDSLRVGLSSATAAIDDVSSLLETSNKPYPQLGSLPCTGIKSEISFDDVSFAYPGTHIPALREVNLRIPAGTTTAIVGRSGSGKTTLINLLLRLFEPTSGTISLDGNDLNSIRLHDWRDRLAVVSQDVHLFDATVRENIVYGNPKASPEDLIAAARLAYAHDFISGLPQGYDTIVGERGLRLSGGQQQRLALARAIIRNPELLILDEATNALDAISEQAIQDALDDLGKTRTVIIIAHRLSTIERADNIIVLADGRVIEQGNSFRLLRNRGVFARMHQLQVDGPSARVTAGEQ